MSNANGASMSRDMNLSLIITDPAQPRKVFDDTKLAELAESMRANGLIQPIMVRPVGEQFVIIHGERRYRAAKLLGWAAIPAEVRTIDADGARWLALVENIQRADLSPIEEANAYKAMLDSGITQTALGERIGKGQSYIATKLRLLKLPEQVQQYLADGLLTEGHAKQLLRLDSHWLIKDVAQHCGGNPPNVKPVTECKRLVDRALKQIGLCRALSSGAGNADALLSELWPTHQFENVQHVLNYDKLLRATAQGQLAGRYDDGAGIDAGTWRMVCHDMIRRGDDPAEQDWRDSACAVLRIMLDADDSESSAQLMFSGDYVFTGFPVMSRDILQDVVTG